MCTFPFFVCSSFKHHVHFGKVKRKGSVPVDGECCTSPQSNNNNNSTNGSSHHQTPISSPGGGGLASDILEWLRPRAFSDYSKGRRRSSGCDSGISSTSSGGQRRYSTSSANKNNHIQHHNDEGFHSSEDVTLPLFVDTKMANAWVNAIPQECLYRRAMSISSDPFIANPHCYRQRSNSEFGVSNKQKIICIRRKCLPVDHN